MSFAFRSQPLRLATFTTLLLLLPVCATAADSAPVGETTPGATRDLDEIVASGELIMLTFPHQESIFSLTNLDHGVPMP